MAGIKANADTAKFAPAWGEFYEISGPDEHTENNDDWLRMFGANEESRHFLFYFRDETFECFAQDWLIEPAQENALHQG